MNFYISRVIIVDISTKTYFIREIHLINDLTIKILIDVNIIVSKKMIINVDKQTITIDNCEITIKLHIISRDARVNKMIKITKQLIIFSHIYMTIFVKIRDQFVVVDRDYFFHSRDDNRLKAKNEFFAHIIDVNFVVVQIYNVTNQIVVISRNFKLKKLQNYDEKNCYLTISKNRHLAIKLFN